MTLQELATAVIYEIPIVVCVINNGWLGMVRQWQELFHNERFSQTHLLSTVPDYKALAEAYGALGFRVDREEDVDAAIMAAVDSGRPRVIDFRVDHEEKVYPWFRPAAAPTTSSTRPGSTTTTSGSRTASDGRRARTQHPPHAVRPRREPARRAVARVGALLAARVQHREPGGRATEREDRSRITIRVDCSQTSIDQVIKQLYKLISVLKVNELGSDDAIERELLLVKVTAAPTAGPSSVARRRVRRAGRRCGRLRDDVRDRGTSHKLVAFEELLRPYGIKETVRTGRVAIRRSSTDSHRRARMRVIA